MKLSTKIVFKLIKFFSFSVNRYRADYYKYVYAPQVTIAEGVRMGSHSSIVIPPSGNMASLVIGESNVFRKFCIISLDASGVFVIGKNNFFNNGCSLTCLGRITIGENNLFGENIKIYDHNHSFNKKNVLVRNQGFKIEAVSVGNNCWIGSNCVILKGVQIGDNVVIGANNLIYKSIDSNTVIKSVSDVLSESIDFL